MAKYDDVLPPLKLFNVFIVFIFIANLQINFYIKKFFYYNLDSIFASSNFKNIYYEQISKKRLAVFICVWRSSMVSNSNNI